MDNLGFSNGHTLSSNNSHSLSNEKQDFQEPKTKTMKENLAHFTQDATIHGLSRIFETKSHPVRRFLWLVLLLAMTVGYLIIAIFSISKYYKFEITTKLSRTAVNSLKFPAVSICQQSLISNSYIGNDTNLREWIKYFQNAPYNNNLTTEQRDDAMATLSLHPMESAFFSSVESFLEYCEFGAQAFDCSELFTTRMSESNVCVTFMGDYMTELYGQRKSTRPGYPFGLKIWINTNVDDYFVSSSLGAGIKVLVQDSYTYSRVSEQAISISPGSEAYLSIEENTIHDLPPPYSDVDCIAEGDNIKYKSLSVDDYSYEGCMLDCMVYYSMEAGCNCTFWYEHGHDMCNLADYYLCIREKFTTEYDKCDYCLYPCKQTLYNSKLSVLSLETPMALDVARELNLSYTTTEDIKKNMILLQVFFPSLHYTKIEQTQAYTLDELVSNLGGQLGLFLGASLLTIAEVFEFVCMILYTWRKQAAAPNGLRTTDRTLQD